MARTPINSRRTFFVRVNRHVPLISFYDWNVVETDLGTMVEPRNTLGYGTGDKVTNIDLRDSSFDTIEETTEADFQRNFSNAIGGHQTLEDFSY